MITGIAVDRLYAYSLDDGAISRHQLDAPQNVDSFAGPAGVVSQIMTTNDFVYALTDAGVYRRYNTSESWQPVTVPANTQMLSSSDEYIYALADDVVWRQDLEGGNFERLPTDIRVSGIRQIDHDEEFGYVILNNGRIWLRKYPIGSWFEYRPLANVAQVVAGIDFIYAIDASGNVFRSKVVGQSGWEPLGVLGISFIAVASDHIDRLWFAGSRGLESVSIFGWGKEQDNAWVTADWVKEDWTEVA